MYMYMYIHVHKPRRSALCVYSLTGDWWHCVFPGAVWCRKNELIVGFEDFAIRVWRNDELMNSVWRWVFVDVSAWTILCTCTCAVYIVHVHVHVENACWSNPLTVSITVDHTPHRGLWGRCSCVSVSNDRRQAWLCSGQWYCGSAWCRERLWRIKVHTYTRYITYTCTCTCVHVVCICFRSAQLPVLALSFLSSIFPCFTPFLPPSVFPLLLSLPLSLPIYVHVFTHVHVHMYNTHVSLSSLSLSIFASPPSHLLPS